MCDKVTTHFLVFDGTENAQQVDEHHTVCEFRFAGVPTCKPDRVPCVSAYVTFFLDAVVRCALPCARLFVLSLLFHLC